MYSRGRPPSSVTAEDRYWLNVTRGEPNECWPWTGHTIRGYGRFNVNGRKVLAHRWGYATFVGPIPDGHDVLHTCDSPPCQNPTHWFTGDHAANMADRNRKGRQARLQGTNHGNAKLTDELVLAIRAASGSQAAIATRFGISQSQVHRIRSGTAWAHV